MYQITTSNQIPYIIIQHLCHLSDNTVRLLIYNIPCDLNNIVIMAMWNGQLSLPLPHWPPSWSTKWHEAIAGITTRRRVGSPPSASGIRRHGRSHEGGASMPGREQCPMQTGGDLCAPGDQRGRGTRIEYDRKGKYSLYLGNEVLPKMPYSTSGRWYAAIPTTMPSPTVQDCGYIYLFLSLASSQGGEINFC